MPQIHHKVFQVMYFSQDDDDDDDGSATHSFTYTLFFYLVRELEYWLHIRHHSVSPWPFYVSPSTFINSFCCLIFICFLFRLSFNSLCFSSFTPLRDHFQYSDSHVHNVETKKTSKTISLDQITNKNEPATREKKINRKENWMNISIKWDIDILKQASRFFMLIKSIW